MIPAQKSLSLVPAELRIWQVALLLGLVLCFVGIVDRGLWGADEPREAAIALEMSRDGDFIIPHLAGVPFVEKPPLYYAVAAAFIRALGAFAGIAGAARLSSACWGAGTLLMTFLLARLLLRGRSDDHDTAVRRADMAAFMAAAMLATMVDFFKNMHWIRVDAALAFFVVAALWCFAEVYIAGRGTFLFWAAIFSAGAFLVKGAIGLVMIGAGWAGLFVPWIVTWRREGSKGTLCLPQHIGGLLLFMIVTGAWMVAFWCAGDTELFNQWFWRNSFGRFAGTAGLGHADEKAPFYYVLKVFVHCLPWTPLVFLWAAHAVGDLRTSGTQALTRARIFLLAWTIGSLTILSLSQTKRGLYLLPLEPAFALMGAEALTRAFPRWCRVYFGILFGACIGTLTLLALAPSALTVAPQALLLKFDLGSALWGPWNGIAILCAVGCIYLLSRCRQLPLPAVCAVAMIAVYACSHKVGQPVVDNARSIQSEVAAFIDQIPPARRPAIAGYGITEEIRALFYITTGWKIKRLSTREQVENILSGKDPSFESLIIVSRGEPSATDLEEYSARVIAKAVADRGRHPHYLMWVTGNRMPEAP